MNKKVGLIAFSMLGSLILMSGGYSLWQDTLTIKGLITVVDEATVIDAVYGSDEIITPQITVIEDVYDDGQDEEDGEEGNTMSE